jgi:hypothetical protein
MKLPILLVILSGLILAVRFVRARASGKHDPVEYYMGWDGHRHPLQHRMTAGRFTTRATGRPPAAKLQAAIWGSSFAATAPAYEISENISNVLKLYRMVRKTGKTEPHRIVFYDPGVCTPAQPVPAFVSQAAAAISSTWRHALEPVCRAAPAAGRCARTFVPRPARPKPRRPVQSTAGDCPAGSRCGR